MNRELPGHEPAASALEKQQRLVAALTLLAIGGAAGWLVHSGRWFTALVVVSLIPFLHAAALLIEQLTSAALSQDGGQVPAARRTTRLTAWLHEVGASTRVFYWEQPFRFDAFPHCVAGRQHSVPAVLLIHGYLCNRGFWNPWRRRLLDAGHGSMAITLAPAFVPIEQHRKAIDAAFEHLIGLTGCPPVIVAHSMGGLAVRDWLASRPPSVVAPTAVVTIGSPHQGTWLARWSRQPNGRQMRLGSDWLRELHRRETRRPARSFPWVCFFSNCDNVVFPAACGALPGADNRHLPGQAHIQLAWHPDVLRTVLELARPA
ncbi:esterase/lipase family protein [Aquabacterium sp. J223]|uniref:esterase/lipase family protein n=1 Tax=Aquabacterium sp. J223 TaxID=2898431 RepID=UPI0021ADFCE0|nr:alpha/beta fold hydrolase [Aquabacterium sp. J223]UUX96499.1 alpha/beta fold hydrolase [Aquabacterium sp. J223]